MKRYQYFEPEYMANGKLKCRKRGKLINATPEELVRQSVIKSLTDNYGFPLSWIEVEEPTSRGTKTKGRMDVLVNVPKSMIEGKGTITGSVISIGLEDLFNRIIFENSLTPRYSR
ncbi:MAG: type I restriction enzyme HsdR N-terminal domain-containing protein [Planctomycetes bacterium]|nr:type I restriction enzyme HsdR N-terminal domain-containing protein [Planctomycetota bacterium]